MTAKKYVAPEFAPGRPPRRDQPAPTRQRAGKLGRHNPIPLPPRGKS